MTTKEKGVNHKFTLVDPVSEYDWYCENLK